MSSDPKKLILASTSHSRRDLLTRTGVPFTVEPSDYEEDMTLPMPLCSLNTVLQKFGISLLA